MGGRGSVEEKEAKTGAGRCVEGRRVLAALQLVGMRVLVVGEEAKIGVRVLQAYLCERIEGLLTVVCGWLLMLCLISFTHRN